MNTLAIVVLVALGALACVVWLLGAIGSFFRSAFSKRPKNPLPQPSSYSSPAIAPPQADRQRTRYNDMQEWNRFGSTVKSLKAQAKAVRYAGFREPEQKVSFRFFGYLDLPKGSLPLDQVRTILTQESLGAPHGCDLLSVSEPSLPSLPARPGSEQPGGQFDFYLREYDTLSRYLSQKQAKIKQLAESDRATAAAIKEGVTQRSPQQLAALIEISLARHHVPELLRRPSRVFIDPERRVALCEIEIPDLSKLPILNKRGKTSRSSWLPVSKTDRRKAVEDIACGLCVRAAYLAAKSDVADAFDTVAVNASQAWIDAATGAPRDAIIASLHAQRVDLLALNLEEVDPRACFRHLKGLITPSVEQAAPIRPIFVLNTEDERVVENRDVVADLAEEANLAAMPWEDFEQLVRQLFEWEFGGHGIEVKVTRASRDRGVDAIMFDPDPLRGGKYVLQAKRYTRTVDVAAVRDLYGTVVNEGANRGILVTTSSYGPDSYEFAKDKPLSLIDGPNLVAMLQKHGRSYRIDIAEARRSEIA